MKIKDIIANLDKTEANRCDGVTYDMEHFISELDLSCWDVRQSREKPSLKSYWLCNHYCTDSYVGLRGYFLNEEFVCLTMQKGRKCNEIFEWVSVEAQVKVREYILSLDEEDNFEPATEGLIDMEEDLGEGYPLNYVGQSLRKEVLLKGEMVTITKEEERISETMNFHTIEVQDKEGKKYEADIRDVLVPWYTI